MASVGLVRSHGTVRTVLEVMCYFTSTHRYSLHPVAPLSLFLAADEKTRSDKPYC